MLIAQSHKNEVNFEIKRYWDLPEIKSGIPYGKAANTIHDILKESLMLRWPNEVPAAYLFSGGLDSAGLVAMHQAYFKEAPRTYSVGFEKPRATRDYRYYSELEQARHMPISLEQSTRKGLYLLTKLKNLCLKLFWG
jgi:asparagine synthase (glutamine-hydrolysing)